MLTELNVQNLATLASVDLELGPGCIAITGDTGAGKSLILDALELALGGRADTGLVRSGTERAQISACFDITQLPAAKAWLIENELADEDELILRRILTAEGRSKAFVNGTPISTSQLRELSEQLVFLHTQHANQKLLQTRHQLELLDGYADQGLARETCRSAFTLWQAKHRELDALTRSAEKADQERALLQFQVDELVELALKEGEFAALDVEQRQLSSGESFLKFTDDALSRLSGDDAPGIISSTERIASDLKRLSDGHPELRNASDLLDQAGIALAEARSEIQHAVDRFELDPARLQFVEERIAQIFSLARKHKIEPDELLDHQQQLEERLALIADAHQRIPTLTAEVDQLRTEAMEAAKHLSATRAHAAAELSQAITAHFPDLGMEYATLSVQLAPHDELTVHGLESAQFYFQPNPGQQGGPLSKIASGGELSRVSLAIQVITASRLATPTLVFDEVDVGIGGKTAARVGGLLQALAQNAQVFVVTHQPQVAGQATAHLHVQKQSDDDVTVSEARLLTEAERIDEIARMLGGHTVTESTRAAARELRIPPAI
jgi:DNA repair protein RecN (Recombination protein N)